MIALVAALVIEVVVAVVIVAVVAVIKDLVCDGAVVNMPVDIGGWANVVVINTVDAVVIA